MSRPYFILTCARSGSTSLAKILSTGSNTICAVEPAPNLNVETRLAMEGRLADPAAVLKQTVIARVQKKQAEFEVYGEKNLTYGPFIRLLHEMLDCRFVFIRRDGREVVRSMIDWHDKKFGSIYRECRETGELTSQSISAAANLPVLLDYSDYSRPRPMRGESLYAEWENLSRAEMCAYYWARINNLYRDELERLPRESWIEIDYTQPTAGDIQRVMDFCGIKGFDAAAVSAMLDRKINSLQDREAPAGTYPSWPQWTDDMRQKFDRLAGTTMRRFGYYKDEGSADKRDARPAAVGSKS